MFILAKVRNLRKDVNAAHARLDRIAPVALADLGIDVVGCSACSHTPENEKCPGCGNNGLVPVKVKPVQRGKSRRRK
jgi:hypothetical protein